MNTKPKVSIVTHGERPLKDTVKKAVDLIGGLERFVKPGQRVLLKPNYTGLLDPAAGAVTSPEILEAIVLLLQEYGVGDIVIGDGCGTVHIGTARIFEKLGITAMAERLGVRTMDLNLDRMVEKTHPDFREIERVKLASTIYEVDLVINIPVIKTHAMTHMTCAVKNLKGALAPAEKRRFHKIHLHQAIADMLLIMPPVLTIVDGITAQEGLGPAEGTPVPLNVILAGDSPLAVDGVVLGIMEMPLEEVKHLLLAQQMGQGSCALKDIKVLGETVESICRPFRPAAADIKEFPGVEIYEENGCSGCIATLMIALGRMNAIGDLPRFKDLQVCVGTGIPEDVEYKNFFFIGQCARKAYEKASQISDKVHLIAEGCAPCALEIEEAIRAVYDIDRSRADFSAMSPSDL